jgi:hypothetical protein
MIISHPGCLRGLDEQASTLSPRNELEFPQSHDPKPIGKRDEKQRPSLGIATRFRIDYSAATGSTEDTGMDIEVYRVDCQSGGNRSKPVRRRPSPQLPARPGQVCESAQMHFPTFSLDGSPISGGYFN